MRIVVSGTHASGKSTLISDFVQRHPDYVVLPGPFELIDESGDAPSGAVFASQLRVSADRLAAEPRGTHLIAERGPLDFLAYLLALAELDGAAIDDRVMEGAVGLTARAMDDVDLLVVLPLTAHDAIHVGSDEHLDLRAAMNDELLDLVDDPDLVGAGVVVVEIVGDPESRVAALEAAVAALR